MTKHGYAFAISNPVQVLENQKAQILQLWKESAESLPDRMADSTQSDILFPPEKAALEEFTAAYLEYRLAGNAQLTKNPAQYRENKKLRQQAETLGLETFKILGGNISELPDGQRQFDQGNETIRALRCIKRFTQEADYLIGEVKKFGGPATAAL